MRKLTRKEQAAVAWARQGYCPWRKRWRQTKDEHMRLRPRGITAYQWAWLYAHPFGRPDWNEYVQMLHRLFATGALK